ncbi:MAG: DNRLRE domain-containing protein, partial [Planctomycetes bacterium]|nr:DNRLRE domain-containing protein [Planctomycetota bacterium]
TFVKCPLGLLWFGDPGPFHMISRHRRAASPLSVNGILFVQGEHVVMGFDAYNGFKLWERKIENVVRPDASREASNLAADDTSFFVATGDRCVRLDAATGEEKAVYTLPPPPEGETRKWGYLAVDKGLLFGSSMKTGLACDTLFATRVASGEMAWVHSGGNIPHSSISIGDGRVFFADTVVAEEHRQAVLQDALKGKSARDAADTLRKSPVYRLCAIESSTGKPVWQKPVDLSGCVGGAYYTALGSMYRGGVLVWFGVFSDGHYWKDFFAGQFEQRRITALSAKDGRQFWSRKIGYRVRPLIIGDTLHAEPWAFDLKTGEPRYRVNPVTGRTEAWQFARPGHHCGAPAANENCMFFRSGCIGYYDLVGDAGVTHFGGQRAGCWINFILANGLVMVPEASSGCMCAFPNMCTVVFAPREQTRAWAKYSLSGPTLPVKHLALNLGAPGDRKDDTGRLWLALPRPGGSLVLPFKADVALHAGGAHFQRSPDFVKVEGTTSPWLYTFGVLGLNQLALPLLAPEHGAAHYTVRLGFAEVHNAEPGQRVFDVGLQGKPVLTNLDVVSEAGGPFKALVKEFRGVEVTEKLTIALVPKAAQPTAGGLPVLQTVEVVREKATSLGILAPSLQLSQTVPEQTAEVLISNMTEAAFDGTLVAEAADGFSVEPGQMPVRLAPGNGSKLSLRVKATKPMPRGDYAIRLKLLRPDGKVEGEKALPIDHLGDRHLLVFKAVEDADVGKSKPAVGRGAGAALMVDGGQQAKGDAAHYVAYLKFAIDVPGKVTSVKLRLWNAGNPSGNGGNVCLVTEPWTEKDITYEKRPAVGEVLGNIGRVDAGQKLEVPLKVSLDGRKELSLAIDPVNNDSVNYVSREGGKAPELVAEFEK